MWNWVVVTLLVGGCGRWGFADEPDGGGADVSGVTTASFGDRAGATHTNVTTDTSLLSTQPTSNDGADDNVSVSSTSTGLLRFDTSALPPGTHVVSAALDLFTEDMVLGSAQSELYAVNEAWTEGTAMGSTAGVANWTMRTPTQAWTDAGAGPPTSRGTTVLGSFTPSTINTEYVVPLDAAGVAVVQAWIDNPGSNNGLTFGVTGGGSWAFVAHESTSSTRRPLLVVSYR